eukprot:6207694-Pleurochrysis_carterae.AAC.5
MPVARGRFRDIGVGLRRLRSCVQEGEWCACFSKKGNSISVLLAHTWTQTTTGFGQDGQSCWLLASASTRPWELLVSEHLAHLLIDALK